MARVDPASATQSSKDVPCDMISWPLPMDTQPPTAAWSDDGAMARQPAIAVPGSCRVPVESKQAPRT